MARSRKPPEVAEVAKALDPYTDGSGNWDLPAMTAGMAYQDLGSSGLRQFGGWIREEFNRALQGRESARVFREMGDNSATVSAMLFAITQSMRKIEWRVEPANDTPAAQEAAEFADSLKGDMSHTWEDFTTEALSMLQFGFAPHEIVYKRRLGRKGSPFETGDASSKYDDGKIGIRRLPLRGQETVLKWFFDANGQIRGMTQQPWIGPLIDLPIEKLLLFRPLAHKNNPEGRSALRSAYRPWYIMKRLEELEAILYERMAGLPVVRVPNALLEAAKNNDQRASATLTAMKKLAVNVRVDEQMGIVLPSDCYKDGQGGMTTVRMYDFELVTPNSSDLKVDSDKSIHRYKLDILVTVLADFIDLGHQARGTQNLAVSKVDMFYNAVEGWLNSMAAVLNRHLLPRVWYLNALDMDLMPHYVPDLAQRVDIDVLGKFVANLAIAGMPLFPDTGVENYLRDAAGMPNIPDELAPDPAEELNQRRMEAEARRVGAAPQDDARPTSPSDLAKFLIASAAKVQRGNVLPYEVQKLSARDVDRAAAAAHPAPSPHQRTAGNYSKGHIKIRGIPVTIETAKGTVRVGVGKDGKEWSATLPAHYGYVKRTVGADGDQVDVYVGPQPNSDRAFIIDQVHAEGAQFDEHKVMLGWPDIDAAVEAYKSAFSDGRGADRIGAVHRVSIAGLKSWLAGNTLSAVGNVVGKEAA